MIAIIEDGGGKKKPKITKSAAAELKAQMEANQVGAPAFEDEDKIAPAIEAIRADGKASVSLLQRRLRLGYGAASRIMDELERRGVVGPAKGSEPRDILKLPEAIDEKLIGTMESTGDGEVTVTLEDNAEGRKFKKLADKINKVKAASKKPKQGDMVSEGKLLVPEPDSPLYKAGKRLADAVELQEETKDEIAEANQEVMKAMRNAKRYIYKVKGYTFELHHKGAEDKVKVIKPK